MSCVTCNVFVDLQNVSKYFLSVWYETIWTFLCGKILFLEYRDGFELWGNVCIKAAAAVKNQSKKNSSTKEREKRIRKQKPWRIRKICILLFYSLKTKEEKEKEESRKTAQEMFYDSRFPHLNQCILTVKSILVVAVHTLLGLGRAMELSCFVINGEFNSIRFCHNTSHNFPLIHGELRRKSTEIPPTLLPSKSHYQKHLFISINSLVWKSDWISKKIAENCIAGF